MKNLVCSKIALCCLSIAILLTACEKENIDETETVVVSNNDDFNCPDLEANVGDVCQDGWGIVTADCDCVENVSEPDCPEFFFEGWSDGNYGSPCETPDVPQGGIISDDCECIENVSPFDCPDLQANIGDDCEVDNELGIVTADCECEVEPLEFDCDNFQANIGDPCQDGWGTISADCDCVENVSGPDCPEFFFEGWSDGNYGSPCETPDVPLGGIIGDDCECVEDDNFCSVLIGGNANYPHGYIGDECWTTNEQQGFISENCECIEN